MGITMTVGARCFPRFGHLAAASEVWSERVRTAPSGARRLHAEGPSLGAFHGALANPIGIDLPVTDRMCRSASEP
jgi:hypothetical protein